MPEDAEEFWDWRTIGKCRNLSPTQYEKLFFPPTGRSINRAKDFCSTCPAIVQCLEFALQTDAHGVWGGTTRKERRGIMRLRTRVSAPAKPKIVRRSEIQFT